MSTPSPRQVLGCKVRAAAEAYEHARRTYLRYLAVFHRLERCYEGIVHPQKRQDVARMLETVGVDRVITFDLHNAQIEGAFV